MNLEPNSRKLTVYRSEMRFKMKNHLEPILNRKRKIKLKFIMCTLKRAVQDE